MGHINQTTEYQLDMKQKINQEEQWAISLANEAVAKGDEDEIRSRILYWMELKGLITIKRKDNKQQESSMNYEPRWGVDISDALEAELGFSPCIRCKHEIVPSEDGTTLVHKSSMKQECSEPGCECKLVCI